MGNDKDSDKEIRYSNERQRKIIIKIKLSEDDILDNLIIWDLWYNKIIINNNKKKYLKK